MSPTISGRRLALDIGGANLKAAHSGGATVSRPFELWKRPGDLAAALVDLADALPAADAWLVTMTAELCDCFATKADGVRAILKATAEAARGRPIRAWGIDGRFHAAGSILERPHLAAASNWLALASVVAAGEFGASGLLVDIGSTTTDLIPWHEGEVLVHPAERTDFGRLRSGALVYVGARRTPLCALTPALPCRGADTPLMAEQFATTLDLYLILGSTAPDPFDRSTGDGGPATPEAARERLARMVGLDRGDFTPDDARALAEAADLVLLDRLTAAADRVARVALGGPPPTVVVAGSGEFLARRVADRTRAPGGRVRSLAAEWGPAASVAACASALLRLPDEGPL